MTIRLCAVVVDNYADIDGYAVGHGLPDLETLPLGRLTNFVWWLMAKDKSAADRAKLRGRIWLPPKGEVITPESPWSAQNETKAFGAFKAATGQGVAPTTPPKRGTPRRAAVKDKPEASAHPTGTLIPLRRT